jgi:glycerol-3-phosphate dehydrogenase
LRREIIERLRAGERWDLLVIGGGATGLGTAVDAASRGYRTVLVEAHDFAKGTSSRSTKLIHGGVRYLAQGKISLVREALHERGLLYRNAPHLVRDLTFVVPSYSWWAVPYYGAGLKVYDLLAGRMGLGKSKAISREEALTRAPTLVQDGLRGAIVYDDAQFDDARLAITLLRTFLDLGGTAFNYAPVIGLVKESGRISGARIRDEESGEELLLSARSVVNATGVFVDQIRKLDDASASAMIHPSQGAHLVLDGRFLPGDSAVLVPHTDDSRVLFAIPWHGRTLIGTTDTPVTAIPVEPRPLEEEVEFLLSHARRYLNPGPRREDVLSVFAGLRPLVGAGDTRRTARISREHVVQTSASGLVTIAGGKWTTYRPMGASAVDAAIEAGGLDPRKSETADLMLHGARRSARPDDPLAVYGSDADAIKTLVDQRPEWGERLHRDLPYIGAEVIWSARHEMARTVEDVLARRTRALILDARASREIAPRVAALMAEELGCSRGWQEEQVRQFDALASAYCL